MSRISKLLVCMFLAYTGMLCTGNLFAQCNIITTIAGTGTASYSSGGGVATAAMLFNPYGVAIDASGNIFIADEYNFRVRKVTPAGAISTIAGNGTYGYSGDGGAATSAKLSYPTGIAVDGSGNIYVADMTNDRIRKISSSGIISTFAGNGSTGFGGDGGAATAATLSGPTGITIDTFGNIYITDQGNYRVRKINTAGIITTIAGGSSSGFSGDGGAATAARLSQPEGLAFDGSGNLYIADKGNYRIRRISPAGIISTIAGTGSSGFSGDGGAATSAQLSGPTGVAVDGSGNIYIGDLNNNKIRKINSSGVISTVAGTSSGYSGDGGQATAARMSQPAGVGVDAGGNIYIAEIGNHVIRKVTTGTPTVAAISGSSTVAVGSTITLSDATSGGSWSSSATSIATVTSGGVVTGVAAGSVTISYSVTNSCGTTVVTKGVTVTGSGSSCNIITTLAGNGTSSYSGDGGAATAAMLYSPRGCTMDASGNLYIADMYNNRIRKISTTGIITTVAGSGSSTSSGDGGAATAAGINYPIDVAVDGSGNLYIAEYGSNHVRKVSSAGIITLMAGSGASGYTGDGGAATAARIWTPSSVAVDGSGNVYFSDYLNYVIRKINTSGIISTVVGTGSAGYSGDGGAATAAQVNLVRGICFDASDNMYFSDAQNGRIRKVTPSGIISTVAGTGTGGFSGDGGAATDAQVANVIGVNIDNAGNIYLCDVNNQRIRKINTSGIISTISGTGTGGFGGDGGAAVYAQLYAANSTAADASGNIYIVDNGNNRIRKISSGTPTVAAISGPSTVAAGSTITLSDATSGGSWSSSATSIATVTSGGVVTGVAAGSVIVSYSVTNSCGISVVIKGVTVTGSGSSCNIITTIAGNGTGAYSGDGGAATAASVNVPSGVAVDRNGNLFIADLYNNCIRKVSTSGIITTIAGNGTSGYSGDGGPASSALVNYPYGIALDSSGNIFVAELGNNIIRKISTSGIISTFAGNGSSGFGGDGGPATAATLDGPNGIAVDNNGVVYFSTGNRIRKVDISGVISTVAGTGTAGYSGDGGNATAALLRYPNGVFVDLTGNLYIADVSNQRIRRVSLSGIITTVAGNGSAGFSGDGGAATSATLKNPQSIVIDGIGNLLIADEINYAIRMVNSSGIITTIAGTGGVSGFSGDGGPATAAKLYQPTGLAIGSGNNLYIADYMNQRIRKITSGTPTVAAISGPSTVAAGSTITLSDATSGGSWSSSATSIATVTSGGVVTGVASGVAIISYSVTNGCGATVDTQAVAVSSGTAACNIITTIGGTGTAGFSGDGGAATAAQLRTPDGVAIDASGNIFVADVLNHRVRKITPSGIISTIAGNGTAGFSGDGGAATAAMLNDPYDVTVDGSGNIYFADINNHRVRRVTSSGIITTIAGTGSAGYGGDGGAATAASLNYPVGVKADGSGNLYISDNSNHRIRKISSSGIITTIAGTGSGGFSGDGGAATAAQIGNPSRMIIDGTGNIYFTDAGNHRIRKISASGIISTIAGTGATSFAGDGGPATAANLNTPLGLALDASGNLFVSDELNFRIRKINPSGTISTFAGNGSFSFGGDGGAATAAQINAPFGLALDAGGNLYIADQSYNIRKVTTGIPVVATISGPSTVCTGSNITLTDSTSGGSWSTSASSVATVSASGVVTGVSAGTAIITYAVTGTCGTGSATKTVTVSGLPYMASIVGANTVCVSASTTFTDSTSGGTWSSSNASIASVNASTGSVTGVSAGSATITYTFASSCGSVTTTKVITVNAGPTTPAIITGTTSICTGTSSTLTDATTGGTWSSTSTGVANINASGVVTGVSAGTSVISYTVTNSCGSASRTTTVVVTSGSTAGTISGASTVCAGATTTFTNTTTGGTWSSSNASIATINSSGVITGLAAGAATITYTVTSGCGAATATRAITVNPAASAGTISGASTVCTGSTVTLTSSVSGGTWASSAPSIASVSTGGIVLPISAGSVTISYAVSGTCGSAIATKSVAVSSAPVVGSISGASTVCVALSTTLTDTATGGTWSSSNTSVATVSSTGTLTGVSAGSATISYAKANACGTASAAKGITVGSLPSAGTLSGASAVCTGATITLSSTATGGTWLSSNTAVATVVASTGVVRGVTAGTVNITYYVSSTCATAIATRSITVAASGSAGTITGVAAVCLGASATLTNSVSGGTWSSSNASIASISSTGVVTGIAAGSVTITYTTTSGCGSAFATKAFTVNALPYVSVISGSSTVCAGTTTTMTDSFSGGGWISSNTAAATISSSGVVTGISAGSTIITYFITNGCGTSVKTKALTINTATAGSLAGPSSVAVGASIVLTATVSGGTWTSSNTSIATVGTSGIVRGVATGTDTVVYTVSTSCGAAMVSKVISVTAHRGFASVEETTDNIKVYPNPNSGTFTLELPEGASNATLMISDITGKVLEVKSNSEQTMYFDMRQYAAGAYLIRVSADGKMYSQKVIIE